MSAEPNLIDLWAEGRRSLAELGRTLDADQAETAVPACPDWTVREVYAHQAGVAADLLAGRLDGVGTDDWTDRQVAERVDRSLAEILDEWDEAAPRVVAALRPVANQIDPRLLADQWTHEQDVRGAVGRPGGRHDDRAAAVIGRMVAGFARRVSDADLERCIVDFGDGTAPDGGRRVRVGPFEFARALLGRRSPGQVAAWTWSMDDPAPYVALVPVFGPRHTDLVEPT